MSAGVDLVGRTGIRIGSVTPSNTTTGLSVGSARFTDADVIVPDEGRFYSDGVAGKVLVGAAYGLGGVDGVLAVEGGSVRSQAGIFVGYAEPSSALVSSAAGGRLELNGAGRGVSVIESQPGFMTFIGGASDAFGDAIHGSWKPCGRTANFW